MFYFRKHNNCLKFILDVEKGEILIDKIHRLSDPWHFSCRHLKVAATEEKQRLSNAIYHCTLPDFIS